MTALILRFLIKRVRRRNTGEADQDQETQEKEDQGPGQDREIKGDTEVDLVPVKKEEVEVEIGGEVLKGEKEAETEEVIVGIEAKVKEEVERDPDQDL